MTPIADAIGSAAAAIAQAKRNLNSFVAFAGRIDPGDKTVGEYRDRIFSAKRNYVTQILPLDSLLKTIPIICDHIFAPCTPVVKNVQ
jgi:hypothetical protein